MADIHEEARIPVYINDEQAKSALKTLTAEANKWKKSMFEAMSANDLTGMKKAEDELKKVTRQISNLKKEAFDANKVLQNLSNASLNDLRKTETALRKNINEVNRGTKEWKDYHAQLQRVLAEKQKINGELSGQLRSGQSFFSRTADGFNKYFGMATAAVASFTGIAFTVKSATEAYAKHDDILSDVKKTTGLTTDDVKELNKEFSKIDTRTTRENLNKIAEEGGRIGIAKDEILDFVEVMDIANVALKDSFQGGTEEISNMLGKLKFLYKETKDMDLRKSYLSIASAINELGAEGVASEQNIAEFTTRIGALSDVLKPSIADTFALGAGFEESGIQAEIASRAYSIVLNRAATETASFAQVMGMSTKQVEDLINTNPVDFFFAFAESLKGMNATETARTLDDLKVNADGANKVIGAAANNTDRFRELLLLSNKAFGEANSVITEFTEKNTNAQAKLEKARKVFSDMQLVLGEKLTPAYASVIHKGSLFLKLISGTVDILIKHGGLIISTTATIATYIIATKLATMWQNRSNTATLASIISQKLQALAFRAQFAAVSLYNSVIALMTGNLKVAAIQFRAFSAALMANPVGIVAGAVVALGAGLYMLSKRLTDTEKLQRVLNNVNLDANKNIVEERLEIERLLKIAQNNLRSKNDRLDAIKKLNEISPKYLGNLTLENINTNTATESTKKYTQAIIENAKAQAAKDKLVEIEKELLDLEMGDGAKATFWQQTWNGVKTGGNVAAMAVANATTATNNLISKQKELNLQKEKLTEITERQKDLDNQPAKAQPAGAGSNAGTPAGEPGDEEAFKKSQEAFDQVATEEKNKLKQQLLDKKITQEQFNLDIFSLELAHLLSMKELRIKFAQETADIESQILDKKLQGQELANRKLEEIMKTSRKVEEDLANDSRKADDDALKAMEADYTKFVNDEVNKQTDILAQQLGFEKEIAAARIELKDMQVAAVGELAISLASMFEQGSAAQIAAIAIEKAIAIAQIWINYAREMSAISLASANIAAMPIPGARIAAAAYMATMSAKAKVQAGINTGIIVAQTVASAVSSGSRNKKDQYWDGGHTGPGSKYEEKGVVHAEEYVIPQEGTKNPMLKPVIDMIELARRNGSLARLDLRPIVQMMPMKSLAQGGFSSSSSSSPSPLPLPSPAGATSDPEIKQLIQLVVKMTKEIRENPPRLPIDQFERERKKYIDIQQTKGL